ncbi:hypothetical protein KKB55_00125 [Myxococcota bacterium]|nr:hypothetical protein [Myxococcota bacterium]
MHSRLYMIKPKKSLLKYFDKLHHYLINEPFIVLGQETDRSNWRSSDHLKYMKFLFLSKFIEDNEDFDPMIKFVRKIKGIDDFDAWWVIESLEIDFF